MVNIPSQPPSFVSFPWYPLTVRLAGVNTPIISANLFAQMTTQLNLVATVFSVRLQHVKVWGALVPPNGSAVLQPLTIQILDPIGATAASAIGGTGTRVLEQLTDFPDQVNRSSIGYIYPRAQREFAFTINATSTVPLIVASGVGPNSVVYLHLQWRVDTVVPIPSLIPGETEDFVDIVERILLKD
jgi:hypothetical protein